MLTAALNTLITAASSLQLRSLQLRDVPRVAITKAMMTVRVTSRSVVGNLLKPISPGLALKVKGPGLMSWGLTMAAMPNGRVSNSPGSFYAV